MRNFDSFYLVLCINIAFYFSNNLFLLCLSNIFNLVLNLPSFLDLLNFICYLLCVYWFNLIDNLNHLLIALVLMLFFMMMPMVLDIYILMALGCFLVNLGIFICFLCLDIYNFQSLYILWQISFLLLNLLCNYILAYNL